MSLADRMQFAARRAQSVIAQLHGLPVTASSNTLFNGAALVGVYGQPVTDHPAHPSGGYNRFTRLPVTFTRDQFTEAPRAKTKLIRTDLQPVTTWLVDKILTDDPLIYTFLLTKND